MKMWCQNGSNCCQSKDEQDEQDIENELPPARQPISWSHPSTEPLVGARIDEKRTSFKKASVQDEDEITPVSIDPMEGHSNVGRPLVREGKSNLSEVMRVSEAIRNKGHVRSPSGIILNYEDLLVRPDRPKTIEERQEAIARKVREESKKERERKTAEVMEKQRAMEAKKGWKGWRSCWGCFGKADADD